MVRFWAHPVFCPNAFNEQCANGQWIIDTITVDVMARDTVVLVQKTTLLGIRQLCVLCSAKGKIKCTKPKIKFC